MQGASGEKLDDRGKQGKNEEHREEREDKKHQMVTVSAVIDRMAVEQQTNRTQRERHERDKRIRDWATIAAIGAGAVIALIAFLRTHWDTEQAIRDGQAVATQQHADTLTALAKTDTMIAALQAQATTMQGQLNEMKAASQDTKNAISGIQKIADTTTNANNDAATFYLSSLRAWMAYFGDPEPLTVLYIGPGDARLDMRFQIQNVGKSVASAVKIIAELHVLADFASWRKNNSICERAQKEYIQVSVIPSTNFHTDRKAAVISAGEWDEFQNKIRRGEASSDNSVLFLDSCIDYVPFEGGAHKFTRTGYTIITKHNGKLTSFDFTKPGQIPTEDLTFDPLPDVILAN